MIKEPLIEENIKTLVDYFNNKGNTRVEFIKELNNDWFTSTQIYHRDYDTIHKAIFKQLQDGMFTDYNSVRLGGHSFWQDRWLVQDIFENGIINPAQIVITQDEEEGLTPVRYRDRGAHNDKNYFYNLHPGIGSQAAAKIAGIDKVPAFIFSDNDHPFNSEAIEINSVDQVIDCLSPYGLERFMIHTYHGSRRTETDKSELYRFELQVRFEGTGTDWEAKGWIWDPPVNYGKIFYNSVPLNIYVGTDDEKNFTHIKNKVLRKDVLDFIGKEVTNIIYKDDAISKVHLTSNSLTKTFDINFIQIKAEDRYKVPKLNEFTGMSIYINGDFKWNNHIFDLFWFGNSNKALSKCSENVILFNCEHLSWKYTDNPINEHIGLLPRSYE